MEKREMFYSLLKTLRKKQKLILFCLDCNVNESAPTGKECNCSKGNTCTAIQYCYNSVCNNEAFVGNSFFFFWKVYFYRPLVSSCVDFWTIEICSEKETDNEVGQTSTSNVLKTSSNSWKI